MHHPSRESFRKGMIFSSLFVFMAAYTLPHAGSMLQRGVNQMNYDRVEDGMTHRQVCAILGPCSRELYRLGPGHAEWAAAWERADVAFAVFFDEDDRVTCKSRLLQQDHVDTQTETVFVSWGILP